MKLQTILILATTVTAVAVAQQVRTEFLATMTGTGKGKVKWKTRDNLPNQFQAEFQAEGERLRPNSGYRLNVGDGQYIVDVTTDGFGVYRHTRLFKGSNRPNIGAGTSAVLTDASGAVAQSGTFQAK
ncbi:MAG: hypothetical protein JST30_06060 [Armatimonadetes bacterium]|nr:hypothetical protein [Armatimonadota bacterium]